MNGNSKERVGHLTQKPAELIRRIIKSMSPPHSIVLDFFAGSATTSRVAIEEKRHSISVDADSKIMKYFNGHLDQIKNIVPRNSFEILSKKEYSEHPLFQNIGPSPKNISSPVPPPNTSHTVLSNSDGIF